MSDYVTSMGKITPRIENIITMKSQRKLAKAIKRAKMMGIIPVHSRAPRLQGTSRGPELYITEY